MENEIPQPEKFPLPGTGPTIQFQRRPNRQHPQKSNDGRGHSGQKAQRQEIGAVLQGGYDGGNGCEEGGVLIIFY